MKIAVRVAAVVGVVVSLVMFSAPVYASLVDVGIAYDDGSQVWKGTTFFDFDGDPITQEGDDLEGRVEWIVYAPGGFPPVFSGYTPTTDELVYAYQIFVTGSPANPVTSLDVVITSGNPADNIGSFSGGGVGGDAPILATLSAAVADWDFSGIASGNSSMGLAFSSPNTPMNLLGSAIDGGQGAIIIPLPSPSANEIPEPSTLVMLVFGAGSLAMIWARRRRV